MQREADALRPQLAERDRETAHLRDQLQQAKAAAPNREAMQNEVQRLQRQNMEMAHSNHLLRGRKGVLTPAECLHTDSRRQITDQKLTQMRMRIEGLEKVLVKP